MDIIIAKTFVVYTIVKKKGIKHNLIIPFDFKDNKRNGNDDKIKPSAFDDLNSLVTPTDVWVNIICNNAVGLLLTS